MQLSRKAILFQFNLYLIYYSNLNNALKKGTL